MHARQFLQVLVLVALGLVVFGCSSIVEGVNPRKLGRVSALVYLTQKNNVKFADQVKAIEVVYNHFDNLISKENIGSEFKSLLISSVREEIDDENLSMLAVEIIDMYWAKLNERFNLSSYEDSRQVKILKEFNEGVKSALNDYNYLHSE